MRSLYFAHKDVEEGVPSKRWDGRNCTYGSVRSKGSTYYTILDELSRGIAYIGVVPITVEMCMLRLIWASRRIPTAQDCEP